MDIPEAVEIIELLADGYDPLTGEPFPENSPYHHPQVVRALYTSLIIMKQNRVPSESEESSSSAEGGADS